MNISSKYALAAAVVAMSGGVCSAQVFHDYENFIEGFFGETLEHDGVGARPSKNTRR